jgi:hypothetical protein
VEEEEEHIEEHAVKKPRDIAKKIKARQQLLMRHRLL